MRHARRTVRLSRTSSHQRAMLSNMARNVVQHSRVRTTEAKAKQARRLVDRLITWGKDGSIHASHALQEDGRIGPQAKGLPKPPVRARASGVLPAAGESRPPGTNQCSLR